MNLCDNSSDGRPCRDPSTDEPCAQCEGAMAEIEAEYLAEYRLTHRYDRGVRAYASAMVDAGRGHLLTDVERQWVTR